MCPITAVLSVQGLLTLPDPQPTDTLNPEEEITERDQSDTTYPTEEDSNWSQNFPQQIPEHSFADSPTEPQQVRIRDNNTFVKKKYPL